MAFGRKARAGVYAQERYRAGLRRWRAKIRWISLAISAPLVVGGVTIYLIVGNPISWLAGVLTALGICAWVLFRDTPPSYVENWRLGAEGERKTEKELRPLERADWHVIHDVQGRYGNYDHVAIGPSGVFLLETKNLGGTIEVHDGVPHLHRRFDPQANNSWPTIPRTARRAAATLKEDLQEQSGHCTWVQAVVVFWSNFPQGLVEVDRCVFVQGTRVRSLLEAQPVRLQEVQVAAIGDCVRQIAAGKPVQSLGTLGEGAPQQDAGLDGKVGGASPSVGQAAVDLTT